MAFAAVAAKSFLHDERADVGQHKLRRVYETETCEFAPRGRQFATREFGNGEFSSNRAVDEADPASRASGRAGHLGEEFTGTSRPVAASIRYLAVGRGFPGYQR